MGRYGVKVALLRCLIRLIIIKYIFIMTMVIILIIIHLALIINDYDNKTT